MKSLKMLGLAAVAAMAFVAFAASSASATTLEVGGVTKNEAVTIQASIASGTKAVLARTDGSLANECATSNVHGVTSRFNTVIDNPGTKEEQITEVEGPLTGHPDGNAEDGLNFSSCTRGVVVHESGTLEISHITGTTNGTVTSKGAEVTVGSPFGTLNCKTGSGIDIGILTGVKEGHATMDISAVINCGFLVPSATWKGTYVVTSPTGLGVSA